MNHFRNLIVILIISGLIFAFFVLAEMKGKRIGVEREEVAPEAKFLFPKEEKKIKGEVEIKLQVKNATSVEFYLQRPEESLPIYLGQGSPQPGEIWIYPLDSKKFPNGSYQLFSQVTNQYGQYSSSKIEISIENKVERDIEKEKEKEEEIKGAGEEAQKEEKILEEVKKKAKEKIKEAIKEGEIDEVEGKLEEIVERVKKEQIINIRIGEKIKEKKDIEKKISQTKKELEGLPEKPIQIIKEDKEKKIEEYEIEKGKIEKEIELSQKRIQEIEGEKKEIKKEIRAKAQKEKETEVEEEIEKLDFFVSEQEKSKFVKSEILTKDSDGDGLSDTEELKLKTDPFNPDSDNDGFLDDLELRAGYDPLKPGPADKIIYQDPRKVPPKESEIYEIERVEVIYLTEEKISLKFIGKGLPNSFVTLYLFSLPTVMIVKTDGNGYWEYILDKPLADGEHTVYAAVTDNHGKIEARSEAFVFMKLGNQIFRIFQEPEVPTVSPPAQILQKSFIILTIGIILFSLGLALISIGLLIRKKEKI